MYPLTLLFEYVYLRSLTWRGLSKEFVMVARPREDKKQKQTPYLSEQDRKNGSTDA